LNQPFSQIPETEINYRASTYAMQTFDGSHFQIVFIEVVLQNTGERINNVLNLIINFLKDKNVSHLLLAVISDNNPINAKRVDSQVPRLWDYNHLKAITNVSFTEVLLGDSIY